MLEKMSKKNKKVLVVDDIEEYAMVMEMYISDDIKTLTAGSINEAKEMFTKYGPFVLAVVDVRLNETDVSDASGMELLSWILDNHPQTEVIMMSAYKTIEYETEALERGAYCFLRKPLQPALIEEVFTKLLKG